MDHVSATVREGEFITILGSSGCGKTTLLKMTNRLYEPSEGQAILFGEDIATVDPVVVRRRMGYVIQQVGLFPHMIVEQNIGIIPGILKWEKEKMPDLRYYDQLADNEHAKLRACQQITCSSCMSAFPIASSESLNVAQGRRLKFFFAGDSLLHEPVYKDAENEDGAFDFGRQLDSLLDIVKDYDLAYYNQETILGGKELGLSGYPRFNSPQEFGEYMVSKGFNLVSTANNHCLDRGIAGINASSAFWRRFDQVLVAGTYATEDESRPIPSFTVKGVRVALMAYTYGTNNIEPEHDWQVNIYLGHEEEMLKRVRQASEENDVVIVAMHWGLEYTHEVHEEQRKLARRLAKAGATIIVGSHSHVVAPFEWIDGVPVFYSMGNLISSQIGIDRRTGLIGSLVIDVDNEGKAFVSDARAEMIFVQYKVDESILCNDIRVISYDMVSDAVLPEADNLQEEYMRIVKSLDDRISFGLRDKKRPPDKEGAPAKVDGTEFETQKEACED